MLRPLLLPISVAFHHPRYSHFNLHSSVHSLCSPEDRAWQNGVEKRLEHLGRAIDQILAHLGAGQPPSNGMGGMASTAPSALPGMPPSALPPHTAAAAFPDMPATAFYDHHGHPYDHNGNATGLPNTAPAGVNPNGGANGMTANGVNYVIPTPAETAAIAAQNRFKRPRGQTVPG